MDPTKASYARYWQPNLFQTLGFSLLAGTIATAVTHPMDFIKTVIQYRAQGVGMPGQKFKVWRLGYNPFRILREMHARGGGLSQFYGGFEANLAYRLGYLTIRNLTYKIVYDIYKPEKPYNDLTNRQKMVIAGFAGGLAAWATTPLTLISIRQMTDTQIKPEWRRNYKSSFSTISALGDQKFKGAKINIIRHVLLNISLTAPYDFFHQGFYLRFGDYGFVKPISLMLATLVSSIITLPFDNIRTRIMNAQADPQRNRLNYSGIMNVIIQSISVEKNRFALWSGLFTYYTSMLVYASLTVGITNSISNRIMKQKGLNFWQRGEE